MSLWKHSLRTRLFHRRAPRSKPARCKGATRKSATRKRACAFEPLEDRTLPSVVFGDFNGDRYEDLAIGIPGEAVASASGAGAVQVIYGTAEGLSTAAAGLRRPGTQLLHQNVPGMIDGAEAGDQFGAALAVGDFDGDGFDDLAVGIPGEDREVAAGAIVDAGAVQVIYGSRHGLSVRNQFWHQDSRGIADEAEAFDRFGAVLAAGDFDGDARDDLAIGVPAEDILWVSNAGAVNVLYGTSLGLGAARNQFWQQWDAGLAGVLEVYNNFGAALATGDFNNDGRDDLAIGIPGQDLGTFTDAGAVSVIYGYYTSGLQPGNNNLLLRLFPPIFVQAFDYFGSALASGDFNNDNTDDLAVGVPGDDLAIVYGQGANLELTRDAGSVQIYFGAPGPYWISTSGLQFTGTRVWHQDVAGVPDRGEAGDYFGGALAVGDFDGDLRDDLAVGVPGEDVGSLSPVRDAGALAVIYNSPSGLIGAGSQQYHQDISGVPDQAESIATFGIGLVGVADLFGAALAVGDINRDGLADLAVAVPGEDIEAGRTGPAFDAGAVHALYGQGFFFGLRAPLRTDASQLWFQDRADLAGNSDSMDSFGGPVPAVMPARVPDYRSNPSASRHIYLDFDGGWATRYHYGRIGKYTQPFDIDRVPLMNRTERDMIEDAWAHVAEDFAPFDVNITTTHPALLGVDRFDTVLIGGPWSDWVDRASSGKFFRNPALGGTDVVRVFSDFIAGSGSGIDDFAGFRIGTTASHELGHLYGLEHKSDRRVGAPDEEYSPGGDTWTPIMGGNLSTDRTIWTQSPIVMSPTWEIRGDDDLRVLSGRLGLHGDDHGNSVATATSLGTIDGWEHGSLLAATGIVGTTFDSDVFTFRVTRLGTFSIRLDVAEIGPNLDSVLELGAPGGFVSVVLATSAPVADLNAAIERRLSPGLYFVGVSSQAAFTGDLGQYTLRIEVKEEIVPRPPGVPVPGLSDARGAGALPGALPGASDGPSLPSPFSPGAAGSSWPAFGLSGSAAAGVGAADFATWLSLPAPASPSVPTATVPQAQRTAAPPAPTAAARQGLAGRGRILLDANVLDVLFASYRRDQNSIRLLSWP